MGVQQDSPDMHPHCLLLQPTSSAQGLMNSVCERVLLDIFLSLRSDGLFCEALQM